METNWACGTFHFPHRQNLTLCETQKFCRREMISTGEADTKLWTVGRWRDNEAVYPRAHQAQ